MSKDLTISENGYPVLSKAQITLISIGYFITSFAYWVCRLKGVAIIPLIVADLKGMNYFAWSTTFFMFSLCITAPLWGKLAEIVGKKKAMIFQLIIMCVGEILCGASSNIFIFILGWFVVGLGAGGMQVTYYAMIGDIFPAQQRGKVGSIILVSLGIGSVVLPLGTAIIANMSNWRYVFYGCIAVYIIDMLAINFMFPDLPSKVKSSKVDYIGLILIICAVLPFTLAFSWAGTVYSWVSVQVIGAFALSIVFFIITFKYEGKHPDFALLSIKLLKNKSFLCICLVSVFMSAGMTGINNYLALKVQGAMGYSATAFASIVNTPGAVIGLFSGVLAGFLMDKTGKFKWLLVMAPASSFLVYMIVGFIPMSFPIWFVAVIMVFHKVLGASYMPSVNPLACIASVGPDEMYMATGNLNFFTNIGQTVMSAILGAAFNTAYPVYLKQGLSTLNTPLSEAQVKILSSSNFLLNAGSMKGLQSTFGSNVDQFNQVVAMGRSVLDKSITIAFVTMGILTFLSFIASIGIKDVSIAEINAARANAAAVERTSKQ